MTVEEAIRHRRTIRRYTDDPVSAVDLHAILGLATMAPNVGNRQMWRFIVITTPELLRMLGDVVRRRIDDMAMWAEFTTEQQRLQAWRDLALHFVNAPAVIVVVNQGYRTPLDAILVERGAKFWEVADDFGHPDIQSVSCVVAYLTLLAEERGYGTCWLTAPLLAQKDLQLALEMKPGEDILAMVTIGRPAETPMPKSRKAVDDLIEWR